MGNTNIRNPQESQTPGIQSRSIFCSQYFVDFSTNIPKFLCANSLNFTLGLARETLTTVSLEDLILTSVPYQQLLSLQMTDTHTYYSHILLESEIKDCLIHSLKSSVIFFW